MDPSQESLQSSNISKEGAVEDITESDSRFVASDEPGDITESDRDDEVDSSSEYDPERDELELPEDISSDDGDDDSSLVEEELFGPTGVEETKEETKEESKPGILVLRKKLSKADIHAFIVRADRILSKGGFASVEVTTRDWEQDARPYQLIPGAVKMFREYCDEGLLGLLLEHKYHTTMRDTYCVAYETGKKKRDRIIYQNVKYEKMEKILRRSAEAYLEVMKAANEEQKKVDAAKGKK